MPMPYSPKLIRAPGERFLDDELEESLHPPGAHEGFATKAMPIRIANSLCSTN
jgi:hypothetical protein